jgi:hypothetical protein
MVKQLSNGGQAIVKNRVNHFLFLNFSPPQFRNFSFSPFRLVVTLRQGWERQRPAAKANVEQAGESDNGATHRPWRNMAFGAGTKVDSPVRLAGACVWKPQPPNFCLTG